MPIPSTSTFVIFLARVKKLNLGKQKSTAPSNFLRHVHGKISHVTGQICSRGPFHTILMTLISTHPEENWLFGDPGIPIHHVLRNYLEINCTMGGFVGRMGE